MDKLHEHYDRCSGGSIHRGTEQNENPIDYEEYGNILKDLEFITNGDSNV